MAAGSSAQVGPGRRRGAEADKVRPPAGPDMNFSHLLMQLLLFMVKTLLNDHIIKINNTNTSGFDSFIVLLFVPG